MKKMDNPDAGEANPVSAWGRFLILTLPLATLIALSVYLFSQSEQTTHLATVRLETAHHIESQAKNIREEIMRAVLHVKFLAKHSEVIEVLAGDDDHAYDELSHDFHSFAKYMGVYHQVRLLDQHGFEVVRANFNGDETSLTAKENLQDKSGHFYFTQAINMPAQHVFISRFTLNMEYGQIEYPLKPVIRYAAPVIDMDGEKIGVVVLNFLGEVLIKRYLDATDVTGENMLLNANSFFIYSADENATWGSVLDAREDQSLADKFPAVWNSIIDERDGQLLTEDGLFTFATISPYALIGQEEPEEAGADDWIIVSHVPDAELFVGSDISSSLFAYAGMFLFLLWVILAWLWAKSETNREQAHIRLQQVYKTKRQLLRRQIHIQEEERRNLARSLHDDMGQSLTSIQAYAAGIGKAVEHGDCQKAANGARQVREITRHIQQSVRNQLHSLRPASLDRLGLRAAVEDMLEQFGRRESISCEFICAQELAELNEDQNIHLFRIVQEALTNVARYAQASQVVVELKLNDDILDVKICDNGCGMDDARAAGINTKGMGLLGMCERTEIIQGHIDIQSKAGLGVQIHLTMPVGEKT